MVALPEKQEEEIFSRGLQKCRRKHGLAHQGGLVGGRLEERRTEERQDVGKLRGPEEEMKALDLNDRFGLSPVFYVPGTLPTLSYLELKTALGDNILVHRLGNQSLERATNDPI